MITLRTGTPGACKTLSAVEALSKMLARWEKHPAEARAIFVHGVKDLALPHSPVPLVEWKEGNNKPPVMVPDWNAMPDGSFVLCDEAQAFFPPRSSASTPPPHVAWLNTHRHRGFDIEVITQHPKLIDGAVRALVGKHQHFRRMFGRKASVCYEWDACSDSLAGLSTAVKSGYPFPKKAMTWYKSAEVHTKQNFRLPAFLILPFVGVAIGIFTVPHAYSTLTSGVSGKGLNAPSANKPGSTPASAPSSPGAVPALAGASAPAKGIVQELKEAIRPPKIAGCMATPVRCVCLEASGAVADVPEGVCRESSAKLGGLVPYDTESRPQSAPKGLAAPVSGFGTSTQDAPAVPTITREPSQVTRSAPISTLQMVTRTP